MKSQPINRRLLTAVSTLSLVAALFVLPPASAQTGSTLMAAVTETAALTAQAEVVAVHTAHIGPTPHTIAELRVNATLSGEAPDAVYAMAPGGLMSDGFLQQVTHAATFALGDNVEIALNPARASFVAAAQTVVPALEDEVFEVVGGENGVRRDGNPFDATVAGPNDYSLNGVSWDHFSPPATYRVNPAGSGLSSQDTIAAVQRGAQAWEDDPTSGIDLSYVGTTNVSGADLQDNQNVVSFQHLPSEAFLAVAHFSPDGTGQIRFDIVFNTKWTLGDGSGTGSWFDVATTATHEFGHVFGLGHTASTAEVMSSSLISGTVKGLGEGDRAGMAFLYPASGTPTCQGRKVTVNIAAGEVPTQSADVILGTPGNDKINGLGGDDVICAGSGDDVVNGGEGDDDIEGENGDDKLFGGPGADTISGGFGNDTVHGNRGNDQLAGNDGNDKIFGYADNDLIWGGAGNDNLHGNRGSDTVFGGSGNDRVFGYSENDTLRGESGDDLVVGNFGDDDIDGGSDDDRLIGSDGIDELDGGSGSDVLEGNSGSDILIGGDGPDRLDGGIAYDYCHGQAGDDTATRCEHATGI